MDKRNSTEEKEEKPDTNLEEATKTDENPEQATKTDESPEQAIKIDETQEQDTNTDGTSEEPKNIDPIEEKEPASAKTKGETKEKDSPEEKATKPDESLEKDTKTDDNNGPTEEDKDIVSTAETETKTDEKAEQGVATDSNYGKTDETSHIYAVVTKEPKQGEKPEAASNENFETIIIDGKNGAANGTDDNLDSDKDVEWLKSIEMQFEKVAGKDGVITADSFKKVISSKESYFNERLFKSFDRNGNGSIDVEELKTGLRKLIKGSFDEKLRVLFSLIDIDGNGTLDFEELSTLLKSCVTESSFNFSQDNIDSLTALLFEKADQDGSGTITFDELKTTLADYPSILDNLTISMSSTFSLNPKKRKTKSVTSKFTKAHIKNNIRKIMFYIIYTLMNIGFGSYAAWKYRESNGFVIVARICGMNLNFNGAFVLVLMLRKSLTLLRMTRLGSILPIDDHIYFHKLVGVMIVIYSFIHMSAHIGNAVILDQASNDTELWEILFTTKAGFGWVYDSAMITGWLLIVVLTIIAVCSMPFVRRSGNFQVFYWTHTLYVVFWILTFIHGPIFWIFILVPGVIFIIEKISRTKLLEKLRLGDIFIEEITLLPSGVIHLEISRPLNFHYRPGDYVFIQIPEIARFEWHPFTISSAPEMTDRIWLHIRSAGNWTKQLNEYFRKYDPGEETTTPDQNKHFDEMQKRRRSVMLAKQQTVRRRKRASSHKKSRRDVTEVTIDPVEEARQMRIGSKTKKAKLKCYIDGPYGTPTREIFTTEHAVLIGAGIGVTPMASILQSALYRFKQSNQTCPNCNYTWHGTLPDTLMKTKKIDFIWINRDQRSFEWFLNLMGRIEAEQNIDNVDRSSEKLIDMQMFVTAAKKKTDLMGISLGIAMDLMYEKSHKSVVTGLETKSHPGRPDWKQVFTEIAAKKKGKVKVFFCGAPILAVSIKEACDQFDFKFSKESF